MDSDRAILYFTWHGAQQAILTAALQQTESARCSFIFTSSQNPAVVHGPLKGTFLSLCCGLKMFNSLYPSYLSCLSPKFSGLIKVAIPSVKTSFGKSWRFINVPVEKDLSNQLTWPSFLALCLLIMFCFVLF